jgi:hypothetical protein
MIGYLTASAPEMRAALEEIGRVARLSDAWLDPVSAAITKARGGKPKREAIVL